MNYNNYFRMDPQECHIFNSQNCFLNVFLILAKLTIGMKSSQLLRTELHIIMKEGENLIFIDISRLKLKRILITKMIINKILLKDLKFISINCQSVIQ